VDQLADTVAERKWMQFFCSELCQDNYLQPKITNRTCSREGCNNMVAEQNRMLCLECYHNEPNIGERVVFLLDAAKRADWERREQAIVMRIKQKVRVYSALDMTQEDLRALVPSLREESA
jgi:hypothetical protein